MTTSILLDLKSPLSTPLGDMDFENMATGSNYVKLTTNQHTFWTHVFERQTVLQEAI